MGAVLIEDFESGSVTLESYDITEDIDSTAWTLDSSVTHNGSLYSLKLFGNTWKHQSISPLVLDEGSVFRIAVRTQSGSRHQSFGITDGVNDLLYSFSGSSVLNIERWVPVYQGTEPANVWREYHLPLGADWYAFYGYNPTITGLIYINDLDGVSARNVWFDSIYEVSAELPHSPAVSISYNVTSQRGIQFFSTVTDEDSVEFEYLWDFGDGSSSTAANPYHVYEATDDRFWRVLLRVKDESNRYGYASVFVPVNDGEGNLPLRINFVGDIMLARRYEQAGGIIPTMGVNAIFAPTLHLLGNAADITVANLEVALTNQGSPHPTKSVVYRGNPANVSGLVYAGIDVVSLANNHTLDYGLAGLLQTAEVLNQAGIYHSGSGANSYEAYTPVFVNKWGLNLAFLRSSDRTGQYNNAQPFLQAGFNKPGFAYMTPYYIGRQIAAVNGLADLKIVEMHAGSEYSTAPGSGYDKSNPYLEDTDDEDYFYRNDVPHQWDIAIRQHAIDAGADLVIVHHPHIIQGLQMYNGKLIAHSLGNFTFDLDYPETMPSMILSMNADTEGFSDYRITPVYIDDYIPKPAIGALGINILDYLARKSREMDTVLWVDKENMEARVLTEPVPTHYSSNFQKRLSPYGTEYYATDAFKLPRNGSISSIISCTPINDAEARLANEYVWFGNFEDEGSSLWNVPEYSTADVFDGLRSAMLQPTQGSTLNAGFKKRMKIYDNSKAYTLHGWIKTRNISNANISIRYFNTRTSTIPISTENISTGINGTTAWQWLSKELSMPSNAYYFELRLSATNTEGAGARALFDNVGLMEWTPWQSCLDMQNIAYPNDYYFIQFRSMEKIKSIHISLQESDFIIARPEIANARKDKSISEISCYPNPFMSQNNIRLALKYDGHIKANVYNLRGQLVANIMDEHSTKGILNLSWNGKNTGNKRVANGIYILKININNENYTRKMMYLR